MMIALLSSLLGPVAAKKAHEQGIRLNPANQNFYYRLSKALSSQCDVLHLSTFSSDVQDDRFVYQTELFADKIRENAIKTLIFDSLSVKCTRLALSLRKQTGVKIIAVCTDNPSNISNVPFYYPIACKFFARKANGYICLTQALNALFNPKGKPVYYQFGILDEDEIKPHKAERPYLYFGGALYERYGVLDLIEAYESLQPNVDLVLSGHGPLEPILKQRSSKNLQFLGEISKNEHLSYVAGAIATINPRKFDTHLDPYSVPSKVLEYLAYSDVVISTKSSPLEAHYHDAINWIEGDDNKAALISFLKSRLDENGNLINLKQNPLKGHINDELGSLKTGKAIFEFINQLL